MQGVATLSRGAGTTLSVETVDPDVIHVVRMGSVVRGVQGNLQHASRWADPGEWEDATLRSPLPICPSRRDYLVLGFDGPTVPNALHFDIDYPARRDMGLRWEYSSAFDARWPLRVWRPLPVLDLTRGMRQSGRVHFEIPDEWAVSNRWDARGNRVPALSVAQGEAHDANVVTGEGLGAPWASEPPPWWTEGVPPVGGTGSLAELLIDDDLNAIAYMQVGMETALARLDQFELAIPATDVIEGIRIEFLGLRSFGDAGEFSAIALALPGNDASANYTMFMPKADWAPGQEPGDVVVGGVGQTFGESLTGADLNDPTFGVLFRLKNNGPTQAVFILDAVRITVWHRPADAVPRYLIRAQRRGFLTGVAMANSITGRNFPIIVSRPALASAELQVSSEILTASRAESDVTFGIQAGGGETQMSSGTSSPS